MLYDLLNISILMIISYFSATLFTYWKVPASRLVGPIIVVALVSILGVDITVPPYIVVIFSVILGVFFGLNFNKDTINQLKLTLKPSLALMLCYVIITVTLGYFLENITLLDKATAFLSVIPGGIAETSILAASYSADMAQITAFQFTRLMTVILIIPLLVKRLLVSDDEKTKQNNNKKQSVASKLDLSWWKIFFIGGIGSYIFMQLNFPAGGLIGALIVVGAYNIFNTKKQVITPPKIIFNIAQFGMGGIIGTNFSLQGLLNMGQLIIPIFTITFFIILNSLVLAWIFSKLFKWEFITSFLSIVPGGFAPMVLIGTEVGADIIVISALQMVRLLTAILIIPLVYTVFI